MDKRQVHRGIIRTGRGAGVVVMSAPGVLGGFQSLTGLSVIPGTLNARLVQPFDLALLSYFSFDEVGLEINLAQLGIDYDGEAGMHYGRVLIADMYPACVLFFTWVGDPHTDAELVSPHHLRSALDLRDGDTIEFTLVDADHG